MKLLWTLAAFLLLLSALAGAQGTIAPAPAPQGVIASYAQGPTGSLTLYTTVGVGLPNVKGAPFSADVITETDRVLADGNHIHQETHGKIFRDSEGRTRNETEIKIPGMEPHQQVNIFDPVENVSISLDFRNKSAFVHHYAAAAPQSATAPPQPTAAQPRSTPVKPVAPVRPELKTEDLPAMQIEGFNTTGVRRTRTVPAGEMGNDKPLVTTFETWTSPDLHTILLTITDDAMSGKTTQKLVNIQTGQPDPQLFQVPPDCAVNDNQLPK